MTTVAHLLALAGKSGAIRLALVGMVLSSALRATSTLLLIPVVRALVSQPSAVWLPLAGLVATVVLGAALDRRLAIGTFEIGLGVLNEHDADLSGRLARAPLGWLNAERRGELERLFTSGGQEIAQGINHLLTPFVQALLTPLFIGTGALFVDTTLGVLMLGLLVPLAGAFALQVGLTRRADGRWLESAKEVSRHLQEFVRFQPLLRMSSAGGAARVTEATKVQRRRTVGLVLLGLPAQQAFILVRLAALVGLFAYVALGAARGAMDVATTLALLVVIVRYTEPFSQLEQLAPALTAAVGLLQRLDAAFAMPQLALAEETSMPASGTAAVSLRNVSFTYAGRRAPVLSEVSFDVPAGSTVAIVGPSGSGKSTILSLIAGLREPDSGSILYGGREEGPLRVAALTAAVFQEVSLTEGTIHDNVRAGRPEAAQPELERVATAAQLDELIGRLPRGWLTQVGDDGARLSGGERQRITVARALLKDAPLLLLDEATSSLDALTESGLVKALAERRGIRTTVVVAHRLHTIASADRVVFLEHGRVVEAGTPTELLAAKGRFATYWEQRRWAAQWTLVQGEVGVA